MALSYYIRKRKRSLGYAWQGLRSFWQTEAHARVHALASLVAVSAGWWMQLSLAEWRWIGAAISLVWVTELLNTAIEKLCDVVCADHSTAIERIKDMAAAAVLLSALFALAIALSIFLPKIIYTI